MTTSFAISCDDCAGRGTDLCDDCVVMYLCRRDPSDAVIIDAGEARELRLLAEQGLVPRLRHRRRDAS